LEFLEQNWHWVLLAVASGGLLAYESFRQRSRKDLLSPVEATLLMNREDAIVIDVRDTGEFGQGHVPNARHIPLPELDRRLSELDKFKERPIILCCASGARSATAQKKMAQAGFTRLYNLKGGLFEWERAGHPISKKRK
jgi:rhodanese-related sulfurtransferase